MKTERGEGYILVAGKPFYLRGGEIHYFRLKEDQWRDRVKKIKSASMNTVSSYMPWFWHEPEEGKVDLEGKTLPERNLRKFLEICAETGLKVIARPGPFVNSELREGGYPKWVFERYPECLSRRKDGNFAIGRPKPAEGEPILRKLVKRWYSYIIPLLSEFSSTKGGPIILCQPDNEISAAWSYGLGNSLYDSSIIKEGGFWHKWLKERYGGIESLSDRYGRKIEKWSEILPPRDMPSNLYEYRKCLDWLDFKREFFADWGITLCKWIKEFGLDVPFFFNEPVAGFYTHGDHPGFMDKMNKAGIDCFTACHNYSDRIYDLEGANSIELAVEITKSAPGNPVAVSVETNHTWFESRLSRSHINGPVNLRMGLAHGLNGSNIYAFVEGRSPGDSTLCGLEYWQDAPVSIDGKKNPCYEE
ncbi:MAG: beta-galactosidase, partial [Candidatus Omnitrophica bacterium]|nr:beta-galactosidase [Candidatus Omnitrophota bacterium]